MLHSISITNSYRSIHYHLHLPLPLKRLHLEPRKGQYKERSYTTSKLIQKFVCITESSRAQTNLTPTRYLTVLGSKKLVTEILPRIELTFEAPFLVSVKVPLLYNSSI